MRLFILFVSLFFSLAIKAQNEAQNEAQNNALKIGGQFEFQKVLKEEMSRDPRLEGANVSASFLDGYVTLNGYVDNLWQKERLIKIGQSVNGAKGVINKLEVVNTSVGSETLAKQVALALYRDEAADVFQLQVVTDDYGRVALSGKRTPKRRPRPPKRRLKE